MRTEIVRPPRGQLLSATVAVLAAILFVGVLVGDGLRHAVALAPWLGLVVGVCWAAFVRPRVEVSDGGIRLVNVLRTVDIRWPAVTAVETRYMLTIVTRYGEFTAWSAPGGGRKDAARLRGDGAGDPGGDGGDGGDDASDDASATAALVIERRWQALRAAGHLDDGRLERDSAEVRWHWRSVVAAAALIATGLALLRI